MVLQSCASSSCPEPFGSAKRHVPRFRAPFVRNSGLCRAFWPLSFTDMLCRCYLCDQRSLIKAVLGPFATHRLTDAEAIPTEGPEGTSGVAPTAIDGPVARLCRLSVWDAWIITDLESEKVCTYCTKHRIWVHMKRKWQNMSSKRKEFLEFTYAGAYVDMLLLWS